MFKMSQNQHITDFSAVYERPTADVIFMETEGAFLSASSETYNTRNTYEGSWS